ncbi:ankyrin repeat domain-containing protein [Pseudidiomarina terrestris]|uniref:ankyrin repeat domain-containing protein n=1 Tax=Pseudidiomarina terrestris TaxID=2820060 RepID=UPI002656E5FC|nr:ankyrin repeat domain-containing protein [Pseudidiomarina sp. 1ASP75-5]MDN7136384.1 ankyrin repeat domain-containing protein [Pseudidiomarina sp. 1ASP75-5]
MAIFDKLRKARLSHRKTDEALYSLVADEMQRGYTHDGLWLKALELAKGDKKEQLAKYIKLRVRSLQDDLSVATEGSQLDLPPEIELTIDEFTSAIADGEVFEVIESCFSNATPEQVRRFINQRDACDDYPIHVAIKENNLAMIKWLLENGADLTVKNFWERMPVELAEQTQAYEALELLKTYST